EKAGHAESCHCVDHKRKEIFPLRDLTVGTAEIIAHMDRDNQNERDHSDQFQMIVLFFHNNSSPHLLCGFFGIRLAFMTAPSPNLSFSSSIAFFSRLCFSSGSLGISISKIESCSGAASSVSLEVRIPSRRTGSPLHTSRNRLQAVSLSTSG